MSNSHYIRSLTLFFFLLFVPIHFIAALDTLKLKSSKEEYFLTPHIQILEDANKEYSVNQISSPAFDTLFKDPDRDVPINNKLTSAYWIRFNIQDLSTQQMKWMFESYDFKMDKISFYFQNEKGDWVQKVMGDKLPFHYKTIGHKNFEFLIPLEGSNVKTFYVRVEAEQFVAFYFVVKSIPRFINYALLEYFYLGIFYGFIMLMGVLNFFLYFKVKDPAHLFYVLYILSIGLLFMTMDGTSFQFLWPSHPDLNKLSSSIASVLMVVSALLYARSFLNTGHLNKLFLNGVIFVCIAVKISMFFYRYFYSPFDLWDPLVDFKVLIAPLILGLIALYKGYKPALYYVLAFASVAAGFFVYALMFKGKIEANVWTVYSLNFAESIEIILLSLALAHRVRVFKLDKEKAQEEQLHELVLKEKYQREVIDQLKINEELKDKVNRELEERVQERTEELALANEQIRMMNELLKIDNLNLKDDIKKQAKTGLCSSH